MAERHDSFGRISPGSPIALPRRADGPFDWELMLCSHILGLNSLHWGVWKNGEALTLENFRQAQARYTEQLLEAVPVGVRTVLDIGCGMGDNALAFADRGYQVTCIAPIANYAEHLSSMSARGIRFVQSGIEAFASDTRFDLLLISESAGYYAPEIAFTKATQLLAPGGHVLVCNNFRRCPVDFQVGVHVLADFLNTAEAHRFRVVHQADISEAVEPTVRLFWSLYETHVAPIFELGAFYLRASSWRSQLVLRLARLLLSNHVDDWRSIHRDFRDQYHPEKFREYGCYVRLLFKQEAGGLPV